MAWKLFDDFTDEHLTPDRSHRLTLALDGHEIDAWDVGTLDFDELRARLGDHLRGVWHTPSPLDPDQIVQVAEYLDDDSTVVYGSPELDEAAENPPTVEPGASPTQVSAPDPVGAAAGDGPDVVQVGEGDRGRASDSTVRAWCSHWGLPCSATGAIKRWVREAYERAEGGRPDEQAWADARDVGAGARRVNGHTLLAAPAPEPVAAPAVVAVGDGTEAPHADAVDPARHDEPAVAAPPRESDAQTRAEELLEQNWTPKRVAEEVGLSLPEVRDLYRELRGGGGA